MRRQFLLLFVLSLQIAWAQSPAQNIGVFFKDTFEQRLRDDPQFATSVGRHEYDNRWSKQARAQRRQFLDQCRTALAGFPSAPLSAQDRPTQRLVQYDFRSRLEAWDLETYLLPVGQLDGFHNAVFVLVDRMPSAPFTITKTSSRGYEPCLLMWINIWPCSMKRSRRG